MKQYTLLAALALTTLSGFAVVQDEQPWATFKLNPKARVKLDFHNANADAVISFYQKATGITIVKDPTLVGGLTITSAVPVTLSDALEILKTTVSLKNFDMTREGKLLVIKAKPKDQGRGGGGFGSFQMPQGMDLGALMGGQTKQNLKVYPIKYANASQVARVLNDVFGGTSSQSGGGGFPGFGGFGGAGGAGGFRFGQGGGGGGANNGIGQFFQNLFGGNRNNQSLVKASADDYSNSVIVLAASREQEQVQDLLKKLDVQTDSPQVSKVYRLKYSSATDLAAVVSNVLVSNTTTGRGGLGGQSVPLDQRFSQAARLGNSQAAFGQVVADTRSNSLVVTATAQTHKVVEEVLNELDVEQQVQNATFVFPLENARADQVSQLLSRAFGTRQGSNPNFTNTNTNNQGRTNTNNNNNNRFQNGGGTPFGQMSDEQLALQLQDPNATSGELATNISAQGFGGFGGGGFGGGGGNFFRNLFGGQGNSQANQQGTIGRDAQGRIVNLRDLTGQVTVIPDTNTNSLIVVATPEYADVIRKVLAQLDRIPEQVMIETVIVEASVTKEDKLGVQWSYAAGKQLNTPGSTGNASTGFGLTNSADGFRYSVAAGNLTALLNAISTDQRFDVLSTPRIFTSNNQQASINISQSVPYVTSTRIDANGNNIFNYAFLDVGIVLTVTPRITQNGYVTLDVSQTANDLQGYTSFNAPIVNQREANTTVSIKDGETIVLGGIIRNTVTATVNKVPLLGDIPILGKLFQNSTNKKEKTELMVFLTPRIVRQPEDAKKLRNDVQKELNPRISKSVKDHVDQPVPAPTPAPKDPKDPKGTR